MPTPQEIFAACKTVAEVISSPVPAYAGTPELKLKLARIAELDKQSLVEVINSLPPSPFSENRLPWYSTGRRKLLNQLVKEGFIRKIVGAPYRKRVASRNWYRDVSYQKI